jgi:hypothetical protein
MTLVSAPAGFGKTMLLCEWMTGRRKQNDLPPIAWVSLDDGDNDPVRFWRYLLTACQGFGAGTGKSALALVSNSPQPPYEALLTLLINEIAQLSNKAVLVLEDYHVISARQIHETLAFLIDHLPATLHLILITQRSSLPRRARFHNANELSADLRFTLMRPCAFLQLAVPFPPSRSGHRPGRAYGRLGSRAATGGALLQGGETAGYRGIPLKLYRQPPAHPGVPGCGCVRRPAEAIQEFLASDEHLEQVDWASV